MSKITDREKGMVVSITFLIIALFNIIFHYELLKHNPGWCIIICVLLFIGVAGFITSLPLKKEATPSQKTYSPVKIIISKLKRLVFTENYTDKIGKPAYGIVDNGIFGARIVAGIITGIRLNEDKPLYEISFDKNSWWVKDITDNREELLNMLKIAELDTIRNSANIKLKYND